MGKRITCDGTGVEIPEESPTTGMFGHQYSDKARPVAEQYLDAVNDLHTKAAQRFDEELSGLRAYYREQLDELPDDVS